MSSICCEAHRYKSWAVNKDHVLTPISQISHKALFVIFITDSHNKQSHQPETIKFKVKFTLKVSKFKLSKTPARYTLFVRSSPDHKKTYKYLSKCTIFPSIMNNHVGSFTQRYQHLNPTLGSVKPRDKDEENDCLYHLS